MTGLLQRFLKPPSDPGWRKLPAEVGAIGLAGLLLGSTANLLSHRGLDVTRDYFPERARPVASPSPVPGRDGATAGGVVSVSHSVLDEPAAGERLRRGGFQSIAIDQVEELLSSPAAVEERVVFVDARDEALYHEGHLPRAYVLDRFYPERYLPALLPAVLSAEMVVVYCRGGECEDSEYAALLLQEAGVPGENLRVYLGGVEEWSARKGRLEVGGSEGFQ